MNYVTALNFYIPSETEWQFAFKGGNKTRGYTYSGSNIIGDVAWYSGNSNGTVHEVKQLQPNELGFYDMSGNVGEFVFGTGSYRYYYGGSCKSDNCKYNTSSSNYADNQSSYAGLRFALKP